MREPAPFMPGERVYRDGAPQYGSFVVDICVPDADSNSWRFSGHADNSAGLGNFVISAPAERFRRCPPGWTEPPVPGATGGCPTAAEITVTRWRGRFAAWRAWLDAAIGPGDA